MKRASKLRVQKQAFSVSRLSHLLTRFRDSAGLFFGSLVPFAAPSVFFAFVRWSFSRLPRSPILTGQGTRKSYIHELRYIKKTNEWAFWCIANASITSTFHGMMSLFHTNWDLNCEVRSERLWKYILRPIIDTNGSNLSTYEINKQTLVAHQHRAEEPISEALELLIFCTLQPGYTQLVPPKAKNN